MYWCYKTASGNHCCNEMLYEQHCKFAFVTKPQAVITVAIETVENIVANGNVTKPQAVITVAIHLHQ